MSELVFVPIFAACVIAVLLVIYNSITVVKKYKLNTDKLSKDLRIVLLSDFHNKRCLKGGRYLFKRISALKPDVIFVAGDTVDRRRPDYERAGVFLTAVSEIAPTYVVSGNHEGELGAAAVFERLECQRLVVDDQYKIFSDYSVLGLGDTQDMDRIEKQRDIIGIFERLDNFKIVLVHRPSPFYKSLMLKDNEVDLVLCGHTHGGAVRMPFFGAVYSPDDGFFPKYTKGIYKENGKALVVSGGLGNTLFPARINNFPEIVVVDVAKK